MLEKILIVDDAKVARMMAKILFKSTGYSLDFAKNGEEAIKATQNNQYAMILLDIKLPDINGCNIAKQLRAKSNYIAGIPIIAITQNTYEFPKSMCIEAGMDDFIEKPLTEKKVIALTEKWIPK